MHDVAARNRRTSRPFVVTLLLLALLAGGAAVIANLLLGTGASPTEASVGSDSGAERVVLHHRSEPWPVGVVAEMIGASDPDLATDYHVAFVTACMDKQGMTYLDDIDRAPIMVDRLDRDGVGIVGFALGIDLPPEPVATSPNSTMLAEMSNEEADLWHTKHERCITEALDAEQQLLDSALASLPEDLQREIIGLRFYDHRDLDHAISAWSACLADAGYDYAHPMLMAESIGADYATSTETLDVLQNRERAIALANYDCRYDILAPAFEAVLGDLTSRAQSHLAATSLYGLASS